MDSLLNFQTKNAPAVAKTDSILGTRMTIFTADMRKGGKVENECICQKHDDAGVLPDVPYGKMPV